MHIINSLFKLGVLVFLILPAISMASMKDCVILLHGMGRTALSMTKIESFLDEKGYVVLNQSYPSLTQSLEKFAPSVIEEALKGCTDRHTQNVHFVTHSLGGILVRYYLQDNPVYNLGRIVMLAPPNTGSEVVDVMKDGLLYRLIMGPNAQVLGTEDGSLPNRLKPITGEIGIIAGVKEDGSWVLPDIPGPDDGKVAVERTKLPEMKDFIIVNSGHTFITQNAEVLNQIGFFLQNGRFERQE